LPAHIDLIKIYGHRLAGEIESIIGDTLDFIRAHNLAIELSTAGWPRRGEFHSPWPATCIRMRSSPRTTTAWRKRSRVSACAKWLFTIDIGEH
jgi:hypothetical protein